LAFEYRTEVLDLHYRSAQYVQINLANLFQTLENIGDMICGRSAQADKGRAPNVALDRMIWPWLNPCLKRLRPLILASESRAQQSLLLSAGSSSRVHPSGYDEFGLAWRIGERGKALLNGPRGWACLKANSISPLHAPFMDSGADTICPMMAASLENPPDCREAVRIASQCV